jgi:hypothetical protein
MVKNAPTLGGDFDAQDKEKSWLIISRYFYPLKSPMFHSLAFPCDSNRFIF